MKRYLTDKEQQQLLNAAKASSDPLALRDYWWMRLLIATGARIEEFSLWTAEMVERGLQNGWIVVPAAMRKGRKKGHEYLVTTSVRLCCEALLALQRAEPPHPEASGPAPLVWGREGARLSVRSYQARLALWAREAGLGMRVSPHWLRHTRGMNIIRRSRGANPLKVAQLALGHHSIASTGVYTTMAREEFARELQAVDGGRMNRRAALRAAAAQLTSGAA